MAFCSLCLYFIKYKFSNATKKAILRFSDSGLLFTRVYSFLKKKEKLNFNLKLFPVLVRGICCIDAAASGANEVHFPQLVMADVVDKDSMRNYHIASEKINPDASRYPYCIVWTPIPVLS